MYRQYKLYYLREPMTCTSIWPIDFTSTITVRDKARRPPHLMNRSASLKSVSRHFALQPANQQPAPQQQPRSRSSNSNSNRINMSSSSSYDDDVPSQDLQAGDDHDRALQRAEARESPNQGDREHHGYAGVGTLGDCGVATPHSSQPDPLSQGAADELAVLEAGRMSSPIPDERTNRCAPMCTAAAAARSVVAAGQQPTHQARQTARGHAEVSRLKPWACAGVPMRVCAAQPQSQPRTALAAGRPAAREEPGSRYSTSRFPLRFQ